MLAEFIDRLADHVRRSHKATIEVHDAAPGLLFVSHNGTLEKMDRPPAPRTGDLGSFESVVEFCKTVAKGGEVYVDAKGIEVVVDKDHRWSCVGLAFQGSRRFQTLSELGKTSWQPRDAVRVLRFGLELENTPVLSGLRRVDFTRKSDGSSTTEHGRETLGKSVEAQVQQADEIPEHFEVTLPLFMNPGFGSFTAAVRVGIDIDVHNQCIRMIPSVDGITVAIGSAVTQIVEKLRQELEGVPVFHGSP